MRADKRKVEVKYLLMKCFMMTDIQMQQFSKGYQILDYVVQIWFAYVEVKIEDLKQGKYFIDQIGFSRIDNGINVVFLSKDSLENRKYAEDYSEPGFIDCLRDLRCIGNCNLSFIEQPFTNQNLISNEPHHQGRNFENVWLIDFVNMFLHLSDNIGEFCEHNIVNQFILIRFLEAGAETDERISNNIKKITENRYGLNFLTKYFYALEKTGTYLNIDRMRYLKHGVIYGFKQQSNFFGSCMQKSWLKTCTFDQAISDSLYQAIIYWLLLHILDRFISINDSVISLQKAGEAEIDVFQMATLLYLIENVL